MVEANIGGVRTVLRGIVGALVAAGDHVTVAYSPRRGDEAEEAAREYARAGAVVIPVPMRRAPDPWGDLKALAILRQLMREGDFDLVHCHSTKAGVLGRLAARAAGAPHVIYSPHCFAFNGSRVPWVRDLETAGERILSRWTDQIVAVSTFEGVQALSLGIPGDRVIVIPNGTEIPPLTERSRLGSDALRLGSVGRLMRQKGFDVLLRAFSILRHEWPSVRLSIAGEGPQKGKLVKLAQELRVPVDFVGRVRAPRAFFRTVDLYVHPARWDSMPLALLEAVANGVPVVATAVGGVPELLADGTDGLLVPPDDAGALASAIGEALADPATASRRALAAHARLRREHQATDSARSHVELYHRILEPDVGAGRTRSAAPSPA